MKVIWGHPILKRMAKEGPSEETVLEYRRGQNGKKDVSSPVKIRQKAMLAEGLTSCKGPVVVGSKNKLLMSEGEKRPLWLETNEGGGETGQMRWAGKPRLGP